ncbi:hypothetical protein BJ170DRAFT_170554 [Xylariales sp. AK1849]|nr:hypothetical protein BJ170DRAFT_170554 [Xylariales sp. AK1849]
MQEDNPYKHRASPPPQPTDLALIPGTLFPQKFSLYKTRSRTSPLSYRHLYKIGVHHENFLYAVKLHSSHKPHTVLFSGPSEDYPVIATGVQHGIFRRYSTIEFPSDEPGKAPRSAQMVWKFSGLKRKRVFDHDIQGRRETFAWRHSRNETVSQLAEGRQWRGNRGWKLMRPLPGGHEELVLAFAYAGWSKSHKCITFRFFGSAADGALGGEWALMAVFTGLRLWDQQERDDSSAAVSSSGAATCAAC